MTAVLFGGVEVDEHAQWCISCHAPNTARYRQFASVSWRSRLRERSIVRVPGSEHKAHRVPTLLACPSLGDFGSQVGAHGWGHPCVIPPLPPCPGCPHVTGLG